VNVGGRPPCNVFVGACVSWLVGAGRSFRGGNVGDCGADGTSCSIN